MSQTYNTRVLMEGYPVYIGSYPYTAMMRNNEGQKIASTAWRFSDGTGAPGGMIEILDQEVDIHPGGEFAVIDAYRRPHIVRVCMVGTILSDSGEPAMGEAKQLTRDELIARIPAVERQLRFNYDAGDLSRKAEPNQDFVNRWTPGQGCGEDFKRSDF